MKNTAGRACTAGVVCLALLATAIMGCSEPITTYQVSQRCLTGTKSVLVLPFMDTRTFVDPNDPHREDLGEHARDIFATALATTQAGAGTNILTPEIPKPDKSLTNAEIAEIGRMHGADVVVAGQVFSFTETRAASIPPRAGMFVRLVSTKDASLLFVGDHYQSAAVPGASGGRDLQAKNVSDRLVQGICSALPPTLSRINRVRSDYALASISSNKNTIANDESAADAEAVELPDVAFDPLPLPPPALDVAGTFPINPNEWDTQIVPEVPSVPGMDEELLTASFPEPMLAVPLPPPSLDEVGMTEEEYEALAEAEPVVVENEIRAEEPDVPSIELAADSEEITDQPEVAEAEVMEQTAEIADTGYGEDAAVAEIAEVAREETQTVAAVEAANEPETTEDFYKRWINSGYPYGTTPAPAPVDVADMAHKSGDELAADLFESEDALLAQSPTYSYSVAVTETAEVLAADEAVQEYPLVDETSSFVEAAALDSEIFSEPLAYVAPEDNGPVYSMPLAVEQPRAYRTVDLVLPEDPASSAISETPETFASAARFDSGAIRVLLLPYHDRPNPNNLIPHTGGGEVVTTLYGTQLSQDPGVQVLWDASGQASHDRLLDKDEAILMGKMVDADYVVRGQVVEFRRAQSVPSFYSVVISTAVLAAQIFFAEMSGVDVATEVYRVSDGACIMSRRDRAQQKYVVQAEKTVRRLANGMASSVIKAMKQENPDVMDPLIDEITPVPLLGNINLD